MTSEYNCGFAAGRMAGQPEWISVDDRLPDHDGNYYTITEAQKDFPAYPKGTISIDTTERWLDGEWWQDDENWKVLYWAEPIQLLVPQELMLRPRAGSL